MPDLKLFSFEFKNNSSEKNIVIFNIAGKKQKVKAGNICYFVGIATLLFSTQFVQSIQQLIIITGFVIMLAGVILFGYKPKGGQY